MRLFGRPPLKTRRIETRGDMLLEFLDAADSDAQLDQMQRHGCFSKQTAHRVKPDRASTPATSGRRGTDSGRDADTPHPARRCRTKASARPKTARH
uniref:Uncharacterized protein n=1 Tax=Aurantimonas manganoxydans TaxID=651183 RepID=A0A0P0Z6C8_9HYPH|nr:hypothetical protein [Aurantimonas manganoxydans SI85-9A1]